MKRVLAEEGENCVGAQGWGGGYKGVGNVDQAMSHQHELYQMKFLVTSFFYLKVGISKSTTMTFSVIILFFCPVTCYTRFSFQSLSFKFCISGSKAISVKCREAATLTPLHV